MQPIANITFAHATMETHFDHEDQFNYILECAMTDRHNFKQLEVTNMELRKQIKTLETTVKNLTQRTDFQVQIIESLVDQNQIKNLAQVIESLKKQNQTRPVVNSYDTVDTKSEPQTNNKN